VDALRMVKKRYSYVDGLLRVWVRLYARGAPPTAAEIEDAGRALLRREPPTEPVTPEARAKVTLPEAATEPRRDTLIEID
jgi:transposase-like protein